MNGHTNVLILDDDTRRWPILRRFAQTLVDRPEFQMVETAKEAIEALVATKYFDLLMLDHDLGRRYYVDPNDPETGYRVVCHIRDNGILFGQCIIHTLNTDAGRLMGRTLPRNLGRVYLMPVSRMVGAPENDSELRGRLSSALGQMLDKDMGIK